jgi:ABC-type Fe3+-hydroxamate transport system substrate-binding protein
VFGVKTYLTPISQLPMQELENLAKEMKTWPEYVSEYKGKDVWGRKVLEYYNKRVAETQKKFSEKEVFFTEV